MPAHDTVFFNLRDDIAESMDVKSKYPEEYRATLSRMNDFAATLKDCPPSLVLRGFEAVQLTDRQREEAISEAKAKGIKAKSGGE